MYIHNTAIFEWDENKNNYNKLKHGLGFELAAGFHWDDAVILNRSRPVDDETRYAAVNYFRERLHTVIFTKRGANVRIISLRRSNKREEKDYETYQKKRAETTERL